MKKLIDRDALIKELNDRGIPYNADVNDCIYSMPIVNESDGLVKDLVKDCISRQAAIDAVAKFLSAREGGNSTWWKPVAKSVINTLPSAQPERDIPIKPKETIDKAWGIPVRQAVCPKCDYYLGRVAFLGDYKGKRVTYCETCGQAIDWEGWDFDE